LIDLRRILVINYAAAEPDRFLDLLPPAGFLAMISVCRVDRTVSVSCWMRGR